MFRIVTPAILAAALLYLCAPAVAGETVITVLNTNDSGPDSLREAVDNATDDDTIVFDAGVTGEIGLSSGVLDTGTLTLTIEGPGSDVLTIRNTGTSQIFTSTGGSLTISGLTLEDGQGFAGGIMETDVTAVTLSDVVLRNGSSVCCGGALYIAGGSLNLKDCVFDGNEDVSSGGGALYADNTDFVIAQRCMFTGNRASHTGGAIRTERVAEMLLADCTFTGNGTPAYSDSTTTIRGGAVDSTTSSGDVMSFLRCTFDGNGADTAGAISADSIASFTAIACTFSDNVADTGSGGAIRLSASTLDTTLRGCTFNANSAPSGDGGAIEYDVSSGQGIFENCTFSGNSASSGGAIEHNDDTNLLLVHCTITGNSATVAGGGLHGDFVRAELLNTLIAGNTAPSIPDVEFVTVLAGVVIGDDTSSDIIGTEGEGYIVDDAGDVVLAALADNGGATQTRLPGLSSPSIDFGTAGFDYVPGVYDQRGAPRDAHPDSGSVERTPVSVADVSPSTVTLGGQLTISGYGLTGATVTVGGEAATVDTEDDTQLVVTVPVDTPTGTQDVVVSANGSATTSVAVEQPDAPSIDDVLPATTLPGGTLTVVGTGCADATSVTVGGETATILANTDTGVVITVPATVATGAQDVVVTTAYGNDTDTVTIASASTGDGDGGGDGDNGRMPSLAIALLAALLALMVLRRRTVPVLVVMAVLTVATPAFAGSEDVEVTTLADSGAGSLRDAIENADSSPTNITFQDGLSGTVTLESQILFPAFDIQIIGDGDITITTDGGDFQMLNVGASSYSCMSGLAFIGAADVTADGSAIFSSGAANLIEIDSCTFTGCTVTGIGGAIFVEADAILVITDSTFEDCESDNEGGAIGGESGEVILRGCTFTSNAALAGGAVATSDADVLIDSCTFTDNGAPGYESGGTTSNGGAVIFTLADTDGVITNSVFSGNGTNDASLAGGAVYVAGNASDNLTISGCRFTGNTATGSGAVGGLSVLTGGVTRISDSTFDGNSSDDAGGAIYAAGTTTLDVVNTTVSDNSAGAAAGGVFVSTDVAATFTHCTIVDNTANFQGAGIYSDATSFNLANSIVCENDYPAGDDDDISGDVNSRGGNVVGDVSAPEDFDDGSSTEGVSDAGLDDLGVTHGRMPVHLPESGSPAIGVAVVDTKVELVENDARGMPRDGYPDAGAAERTAPTVRSLSPSTVAAGGTLTISGFGLLGASVTVGGEDATIESSSELTLVITLALDTPDGAQDVVVSGPGGTATQSVTVEAASPVIDEALPDPVNSGATLTLVGTNLADATSVTVGGETATIEANTDTILVVTLSESTPTGSQTVSVTTALGTDDSVSVDVE